MSDSRYEYIGRPQHPVLVGRHSRSGLEDCVVHRATVMRLLPGSSAEGRRGSICILGAGKCHDVDLNELLGRHHEVHLVDQDIDIMKEGVDEQRLSGSVRIRFHARDLNGLREPLLEYSKSRDQMHLDRILQGPASGRLEGLERFELVLSANCLPRLFLEGASIVGGDHPQLDGVFRAIRRNHLSEVLELLLPKGQALVVLEMVTSNELPQLARTPESRLGELLGMPGVPERFQPGCNPAWVDELLCNDPSLTGRMSRYDISSIWLKQYSNLLAACIAFQLTRRPD